MNGLDLGLHAAITEIVAFDGHGHPLPLGVEAVDHDHPINPYPAPLGIRQRPTNPEYLDAWRALWGYEHNDFDPMHLAELIDRKLARQAEQGYHGWVFEQLVTDAMIYIGTTSEPSFEPALFRWCAHVDWLLWPFVGEGPPDAVFVEGFHALNQERCRELGLDGPPATLAQYLENLVVGHLRRVHAEQAVGIKSNTAYYRTLRFDHVPTDEASALYTRARSGQPLSDLELKALQDHIFIRLVTEAGSLGLPVQIHTGLGARPHFDITRSDPLLLESVFRTATRTTFILLHGGWPYDRQAIAALAHENVHLDFSVANLYFYPRRLADLIRATLEWFPEKLLYGSDTHSDRSIAKLSGAAPRPNPLAGWEEKSWLVDRTSRLALGLALTGMSEDGQLQATDAEALARGVLHDNATQLYRI